MESWRGRPASFHYLSLRVQEQVIQRMILTATTPKTVREPQLGAACWCRVGPCTPDRSVHGRPVPAVGFVRPARRLAPDESR